MSFESELTKSHTGRQTIGRFYTFHIEVIPKRTLVKIEYRQRPLLLHVYCIVYQRQPDSSHYVYFPLTGSATIRDLMVPRVLSTTSIYLDDNLEFNFTSYVFKLCVGYKKL